MLFLCWNKNVPVGRTFMYYEHITSYIYSVSCSCFYLGSFFNMPSMEDQLLIFILLWLEIPYPPSFHNKYNKHTCKKCNKMQIHLQWFGFFFIIWVLFLDGNVLFPIINSVFNISVFFVSFVSLVHYKYYKYAVPINYYKEGLNRLLFLSILKC